MKLFVVPAWVLVVVDLVLVEVALTEGEVVEVMTGAAVHQEEICLVEEVIRLLEVADLNIQQLAMTPDPSTILVILCNRWKLCPNSCMFKNKSIQYYWLIN